MNETELLQSFRESRSEAAFAQLVRRYAGLVYSVAKRRLANASLAEDITQLVFIRLAKTPPKVQSHAELAAWLHRTTVNVTIDTWRSETRRRNREQQAIAMEPATPENAVWEDIAPNLDDALNQLNDEDRQALLLRFFGQKAMRDVGAALGVGEDAAKMRVSRALDRLRTQLGVGSVVCTAAVLGTMLTERSVEAVPVQLLSRLSAIKLPAAVGAAGLAGLLSTLMQVSKFNLAAGTVVLAVIGVGTVHLIRSLKAPAVGAVTASSKTNLTSNTTPNATGIASRNRFDSGGFNTPLALPAPEATATKPTKMMFHVLDAVTGDGLAKTKIHAAYFGAGGMGEGHDLFTDNAGIAAIPEPDDATKTRGMNIFVVAEKHVPISMSFSDSAPSDYTVKLDPAMTAEGVVLDEQGFPVPGVTINILGQGIHAKQVVDFQAPPVTNSYISNGKEVKKIFSGVVYPPEHKLGQREQVDFQTCPVTNRDDGSWSCSYIPKDYTNEIRFLLKKPGYAPTFPVVPVAKVDLKNLVFVINRGFAVTGQVTDQQTRPVANARINTLKGNYNQQQSAAADENGIFTLTGVPGDTAAFESALATNNNGAVIVWGLAGKGQSQVELAVQADGYAPQTSTVELASATNIANFTLSPGNIFRGRVVDEDGNAITNAIIRTDWDFINQIATRFEWKTNTDGNGRFEWNSAPAEKICYWFEADGYSVIRGFPLPADGGDHKITLKRKAEK